MRLGRNTTATPEYGSRPSSCSTTAARPSCPLRKSTGRVATTTRIPVPATFIEAPVATRRSPRSALCRYRRRGAPSLRVPRSRPTPSNRGPSRCPPRAWRRPVPARTRRRPARVPAPPMTPPRTCPGVRGYATPTTACATASTRLPGQKLSPTIRALSSALQRRRDRRFADTTEPSPLARSQSRPAVELRSESCIG